jgi:peptidoglycan/xylan/chitin deacetylase (PgdA/CDA1 family)
VAHSVPASQAPVAVGRGGPITFEASACTGFPPIGPSNGHSVFLDAGHGGADPGATSVLDGRRLAEKQVTLAVTLITLPLLREDGYRVVMSRISDSTVAVPRPGDLHENVLTPDAAQREIEARNLCADAAHVDALVAVHMDSYSDPAAGGAETVYCPSRPFAAGSRRLAGLIESQTVGAMRLSGRPVLDRGVLPDQVAGGRPLTPQTANYHHLIELGPADPPWLPYPSSMPGALVEPGFLSNPSEASFVLSARGQRLLAGALVAALDAYFRTQTPAPAPPPLRGQIPDRLPTSRRVVALTFDAGADNGGAPKILATLARTGVPATFFMTGRWAELYPQWARRIVARYPVGNHTFDHTDLLRLSLPGVATEIRDAETAIQHATGQPPLPLFRFPYGSSNAATLAVANRLGETAVGWTVDTLGWEGTSLGQSVDSVRSRALAHLEPGEIILMHVGANPADHSTLDADALAAIISDIRSRGYGFTTIPSYL